MAKNLEHVIDKKVHHLLDDALKTHLGFTIDQLKEDLASKIKKVPFLDIDIDVEVPFKESKQRFLKHFVTRLIRVHLGNISEAAKTAGVERRSLHRMVHRFNIPIDAIRKDLVKTSYIYERNIMSVIDSTLRQYQSTLHPKKIEDLKLYAPNLSREIARELPRAHMTLQEAEQLFEYHYFKELLKHWKTVAQAAKHAGVRSETLHRKMTRLGLRS